MNAKETIKYLYKNGHITLRGHYDTITKELNKPVTEHPGVQKLIGQMVVLQSKYDKLNASHNNLFTLLGRLYDHASYNDAGEWVLEDKSLQDKVNKALKEAGKI